MVLILMFIKLGQCEFFVVHSEGWSCAENIITGQSGAQFLCEISLWCCMVLDWVLELELYIHSCFLGS